MQRYLFVVSRDQPALCAHLAREFNHEDGVEVVLDRRQTERRAQRVSAEPDRRQSDRRRHPSIAQTLESLNFALVRGD